MEEPADLPLLAFSCREDPRDALVLPQGVQPLDLTRPVGCASLRRTLQFQVLYPDARVEPVRGNVLKMCIRDRLLLQFPELPGECGLCQVQGMGCR